jgi:hypothetical protein
MHVVALRLAGLLIVVLTVLRIPDYLSRFLVSPDRSFLIFFMIAIMPLAISLVAGMALWRYAEALGRLVSRSPAAPDILIGQIGYRRLLSIGIAVLGVFLLVEGTTDLAYWIGRYFQMKIGMPHVQVELGEEFVSIFSTLFKVVTSAALLLYARKAARDGQS